MGGREMQAGGASQFVTGSAQVNGALNGAVWRHRTCVAVPYGVPLKLPLRRREGAVFASGGLDAEEAPGPAPVPSAPAHDASAPSPPAPPPLSSASPMEEPRRATAHRRVAFWPMTSRQCKEGGLPGAAWSRNHAQNTVAAWGCHGRAWC